MGDAALVSVQIPLMWIYMVHIKHPYIDGNCCFRLLLHRTYLQCLMLCDLFAYLNHLDSM